VKWEISKSFCLKRTSDNYQFVTPAPYQVRDELRRGGSDVKSFWIPAFAGMTFLEVVLILNLQFKTCNFHGAIKYQASASCNKETTI